MSSPALVRLRTVPRCAQAGWGDWRRLLLWTPPEGVVENGVTRGGGGAFWQKNVVCLPCLLRSGA